MHSEIRDSRAISLVVFRVQTSRVPGQQRCKMNETNVIDIASITYIDHIAHTDLIRFRT